MISRRIDNRCDGKFSAKFNCKYKSVIVTDKTTILTVSLRLKYEKFYHYARVNMQLGDV